MNGATRAIVATMGVVFAISGMSHGFFEVLQGNTPTGGLVISAIGEEHRMWVHGAEGAFTLVPNFLVTGILAITVSVAIMVWSIGFVHKKNGPTIFLLLFVLLFMVGGGIAQVLFFVPLWAVATRIHSPLSWWRGVLSGNISTRLGNEWQIFLAITAVLFLIGLYIAIFGYIPGLVDPDQVLMIMISVLTTASVTLVLTFIAGFAHDIGPSEVEG